jgi:hypothetical protein
MNRPVTSKFTMSDSKVISVLTLLVLAFVVIALMQDFLQSNLKNSSFYISESFIFSSFWWLFAPLLFTQYSIVTHKYRKELKFHAVLIILPIFLHLFAFPSLVWLLSKVFYYHTYSFQQTFRYTLSEHLYLLVLFYSIPIMAFQFFLKTTKLANPAFEAQNEGIIDQFISNIIVSDGNKKHSIIVSEILYFSANPPYITLHLESKKHLYNETLKSISIKLNPEEFIRIHKSTIVNIKMVTSYTTRLNGDYDLKLKNDVQLRISRNFASDFKILFNKTHHLATK